MDCTTCAASVGLHNKPTVINSNGDYLFHYGQSLYLAEEYEEAISILEQAKLRTTDPYLYTSLGSSYQALKQYDKAEDNFQFAVNLNPYRFYPLYLLALLYEEKGDFHRLVVIAQEIMQKEVKVSSIAIDEIRDEMNQILNKYQ